MNKTTLILLSSIGGLAAGFSWRALRQEPDPLLHPSSAPNASGIRATGSIQAGAAPGSAASSAASASETTSDPVTGSAAMADNVTRWLHWMTLVEKSTPAGFPRLAAQAQALPGALKILAAHWIEKDPRSLFDACFQGTSGGKDFPANELMQMLLEEWPKKDPDAVFAALKSQPGMQRGWQMSALNGLFQVHPEQALITMSALGIDSYGPDMKGIAQWAASDPGRAAEVALTHPAGFASQLVVETIAKEWAASDPHAALQFAASRQGSLSRQLESHLIRNWVERNITEASNWFAAAEESSRERLLPSFVEAWGKKDAPAALDWCIANTEGGRQSEVINALVKGAAQKDPDAAASMIADMEISPSRTKAAVTFADTMLQKGWWPRPLGDGTNQKAKPEAVEWMAKLDPETRKQVISNIQWGWSEADPRGFAEYLQSPAGRDADPDSLMAAARVLVRQKPLEALEWASQATPETRESALSETFAGWVRYQPEAASEWLQKLPASDPRRESLYLGWVTSSLPANAFATPPPEEVAAETAPPPNALSNNTAPDAPSATTITPQQLAGLLASDPSAARKMIEQLPLPENVRSGALTKLGLR